MVDDDKITEVLLTFEEELDKAINHLINVYNGIRAGRANPKILDKILVNYYGEMTPLKDISNISVQDARMLAISLYDQNALKETIKSLSQSDIGINPVDDGRIIRLVFPPLTEERRRDIVKQVKKEAEETKVTCRNARRDAMDTFKKMKKDSLITEDEIAGLEKDIQKTLDSYILKVDNETNLKEKELMSI